MTFLTVLALAKVAGAQTKLSGTAQCGKPDHQQVIEAGDRPIHSFMITQGKCTWTTPMEYEGIQDKEGVGTRFDEVAGNSSRLPGYFLDALANGHKTHYRFEGIAPLL